MNYNRRDFMRLAGIAGAAALAAPSFAFEAAKKRRHQIGATGILWGPVEPALKDIAALGYVGYETFGSTIEDMEKKGTPLGPLLQKYQIPFISSFNGGNVLDPAKKQQSMENLIRWSKLVKGLGGKVIVYCADGGRKNYDYKEHKQNIIDSMNDYAKAITDQGLICALHPHTGTPIETQEEIDWVMNAVDTRYMRFAPDIGQIQKGGGDPVKVVKDYLSLTEHMHLKDFAGQDHLDNGYVGYCALGEGQVNLKAILDMMETKKNLAGMIMYEQDGPGRLKPGMKTPTEEATITKDYLVKLGYKFDPKTPKTM
ncbi:MAG TPA: TIM barrel protein [Mucilaginibacter sp.]|jgi:inosose dehydratase|nr:TIM barrel protein [Mucilaginibacter sp.]